MKLTKDYLVSRKACKDQVAIFAHEWPDGAEITEENARRAVELGLDLSWLAGLLPVSLVAEYQRQEAPLVAEYQRQEAPLVAEYERQEAPLWAEYQRQEAPLVAEYQRQVVLILVPLLDAALREGAKEET